jgi:hypothetical protein
VAPSRETAVKNDPARDIAAANGIQTDKAKKFHMA